MICDEVVQGIDQHGHLQERITILSLFLEIWKGFDYQQRKCDDFIITSQD